MAEKRRPGYDGRCSRLTPEEIAAFEAEGRSSVVRVRVPNEGQTTYEDLVIGPVTTDFDRSTTLPSSAPTAPRSTTWRWWSTTG